MTGKARLTTLASELAGKPKGSKKVGGPANPPYGEEWGLLRITVTLDPETYEPIATEAVRRKVHKEKDAQLSTVIREAVAQYLQGAVRSRLCMTPNRAAVATGLIHHRLTWPFSPSRP
jgi:hypothetical protein